MSNFVNNLYKEINSNNTIVFCGAGISYSSGLPLVNDIKRKILEGLKLGPSKQKLILDLYYKKPFEFFMEAVISNGKADPLLRMFRGGYPGLMHYFLAKAAKKKKIKIIVTTNFDTLIEKAMDTEGVKYRVLRNNEDFNKLKIDSEKKVIIIKIHGSIDVLKSLAITISYIAQQNNLFPIQSTIKAVMNAKNYNSLMVMGYSCSDIFDINPTILNLSDKSKYIYYIKHFPDDDKSLPSVFKGYSGEKGYSTDKIIDDLWNKLSLGGKPNSIKHETDLTNIINNWIKTNTKNNKAFCDLVVGNLYMHADQYKEANKYFSKIVLDNKNSVDLRIRTNIFIGNNYRDMRSKSNYQKAINSYDKARKLSVLENDIKGEATSYLNMGIVHEDQNNHTEAIKCYDKTLELVKDKKSLREVKGKALGNKGIVYKNMGSKDNFEISVKLHDEALKIAQKIGDKKSEGRCFGNLGISYDCLGKKNKAFSFFEKAYGIARDLGDIRHQAIWLYSLGIYYKEDAIEKLTEARDLFISIESKDDH